MRSFRGLGPAASLVRAGTPVPPAVAVGPNAKAEGVFRQAEKQTRRILGEMENSLRLRLENDDAPFSEVLRMHLMRIAMWPPLSGMVQEALEFLGDSAEARERFSFLMPFVEWMSQPFLFPLEPGDSPETQAREAEKVFKLMTRLKKQGFTTSLDNVGDASLSPRDAKAYRDYYANLIRAFVSSDSAGELNMSLKLSALVHGLDKALAKGPEGESKRREIAEGLSGILQDAAHAPGKNIFLRIDMEEYAFKDLTLDIFRQTVENNPSLVRGPGGGLRLGVVIQAYLRDSALDLRKLIDWGRSRNLAVPVRLVKGAYLDHERAVAAKRGRPSPVWDHKPSTDANYEALSACMLLNRDAIVPAFATHNIRTQSHAMALAEAYGLPPEAAPIQMLYGMGDPLKLVIAAMGRPLREYIPAGSWPGGLNTPGRRFRELANSDNALAQTMLGDFSGVDGSSPAFVGKRDREDSGVVKACLEQYLNH